ncbi:MAG: hypothetical protein HFH55_12975 [Lachnospiraceae bacterium]|nr:hypothetical protein [Lachnospiraceae bacterium]
MTNKEKYKQAFSVLHSSGRQFLEVEEMMKVRKKARSRVAAAAAAVCMVLAGGGSIAYAADVGGVQRTIQIWIHGDQTDADFEYGADGTYWITYPSEDGTVEERGGGIAIEDDGSQRPLSEGELLQSLDDPDVVYEEDGTVWVYYHDQKIEITDRFQDGICYVKVSKGEKTFYMTIKYQDGWCADPHKYVDPKELE